MKHSYLSSLFVLGPVSLFVFACPDPPPECEGKLYSFGATVSVAEAEVLKDIFDLEPGGEIPACEICEYVAYNLFGEELKGTDCEVDLNWEAAESSPMGSYSCTMKVEHCDELTEKGAPIPLPPSTLVENDCGAYDSAKSISQYGGGLLVHNYNATWDDYTFVTDDGGLDAYSIEFGGAKGGNVFNPGEQMLTVQDPDGVAVGQTCLEMPAKLGHTVAVALPDGTFFTEFLVSCVDPKDVSSDTEFYDLDCVDKLANPVPVGGAKLRVVDGTGQAHHYLRFSGSTSAFDKESWLTPDDFTSGVYSADFVDVSSDMLGQGYTCICIDDDENGLCDDDQVWPVPEIPGSKDIYEQYWALLFVTMGAPGEEAKLQTRMFYPKVTGSGSPSVFTHIATAPGDIPTGAWDACEEAHESYKR